MNAHHKEVADVYIEDGTILAVQPNIKVIVEVVLIDWELNNKCTVGELVGPLVYCD